MSTTLKNETATAYNAQPLDTQPAQPVAIDLPAIGNMRLTMTGYTMPETRITNKRELETYCKKLIQNEPFESMRAIFVNIQCQVVGDVEICSGDISECSAYIRKIMTYAILCNAACMFLTHNHPGGTCAPSQEDIQSTLQVIRAFRPFGIRVLDHCIVTPQGACYSMASSGDVNFN